MHAEVIEGTVEIANLKRATKKVTIYDSIAFRRADGSQCQMEKVAVSPGIAEALKPGAKGRFYTYKAFDHRGLVAVRIAGGRSSFAMPSGNERIMLVAMIAGAILFVLMLLSRGSVSILGAALAILGGLAYFSYRKLRLESRAQFDADGPPAGVAAS